MISQQGLKGRQDNIVHKLITGRGVGTVKFQVKQLKKILDKFANLLNFLHFQPLISGEAPASPVPPWF